MPLQTEKEKMLAGESYNIHDPELEADREKVKELLLLFNHAEDVAEKRPILEQLLGKIGQNSFIEPPFYCSYGQNTYIGDYVFINSQCTFLDNNEVWIGSHVMFGPLVQVYTAAHLLQAKPRNEGWEVAKPIVIEDDVWIGGGAILLPGVIISRGAVVGAGTVVSRDVPPNTIVAGNPAQFVKMREI